jgi:hypothetical protein
MMTRNLLCGLIFHWTAKSGKKLAAGLPGTVLTRVVDPYSMNFWIRIRIGNIRIRIQGQENEEN